MTVTEIVFPEGTRYIAAYRKFLGLEPMSGIEQRRPAKEETAQGKR